jgi:ribosomal protein S18 acetylase RimI-like enzyme
MRLCSAAGFDYLSAKVDSDNVTGVLALYERLGFTTNKIWIIMEKKQVF